MKNILTYSLLLFISFHFGYSQQDNLRRVTKKVEEYQQKGERFESFDIFSEKETSSTNKYEEELTDVTVLNVDFSEIQQIIETKPKTLSLSFPYKGEIVQVQLYKRNIFTADFSISDEENTPIHYQPGVYYRGVEKGNPESIVAFSFFEDDVVGITSTLEKGNIVVGKTKDGQDFLSYADHDLTSLNPFTCKVEELRKNKPAPQNSENQQNMNVLNDDDTKCIRIYYEIAYQPYVNNNEDITQTINWITAIHNNIETLYDNDGVKISLHDIMLWTTPDPFDGSYEENLEDFAIIRQDFNGDLAHLVNSPTTTSVAYINSLCSQISFAYSGVSQFYEEVPTYSWTVNAMTHEMGHSMGSPHTHACFWNGDGTAIDGCGPEGGADEGCDAPLPDDGGTIMSYCHLVESVGVNLAKGFGSQPGSLIRNNTESKSCLSNDCGCISSINVLSLANISTNSTDVELVDNSSDEWIYRVRPYNDDSGNNNNNWTNITTTNFEVENLEPNTYYTIEVGNICESGAVGGTKKILFLTDGDYCNEDVLFTDTGGENENHEDREYLVKTFYPNEEGFAINLTFSEFHLEEDFDFLTVYDGEDSTAPVFENGDLLTGNLEEDDELPDTFEATNDAGAITIVFTSDMFENEKGWVATVSCSEQENTMGVNNASSYKTNIYPNPGNSEFTIKASEKIDKIIMYDLSGRKVFSDTNLNQTEKSIDTGHLSSGAYLISITSGAKKETLKWVKQ